jgi:hypothetical protein
MTDLSADWQLTGWGYITNGTDSMAFAFEDWKLNIGADPKGDDMPGDTHYGYDLGTRARDVSFSKCVFGAKADIEEIIATLDSWNNSGVFTLKVQVKSDGTCFKLDGNSDTLLVLFEDIKGITKLTKGDIQKYGISKLKFKQYG